jgi:arginine/serine-rich splicing factor 17
MKVTGFKELLKIRTGESKLPFPSKYDWDSFFRDAKNMNEMKAGERPDTIHFQNLPCKWFADGPTAGVDKPLPSERVFRRVWDGFGDVRAVDIPICDPFRSQMTTAIGGIKTFTFSNDSVFEAYVQYKDYISFVKAMDALRGCFLFYQETGKSWVANVKVRPHTFFF